MTRHGKRGWPSSTPSPPVCGCGSPRQRRTSNRCRTPRLDVALCYGWIDGQKKTFDDATWLQKFTPRGTRSIWSKINREKVQRLVESGRMQSPGLEAVDRAKANGQWDSAYDSHRTAGVPDDLQRALDAHPKAKAFFATLNSANRYAILFRIQTVKRAGTRAKKIEQFVGMLERHEVIHS